MKNVMVLGAGGFIGGHLVKRLLDEDYTVIGVDIKPLERWWQAHDGTYANWNFDCSLEIDMLELMQNAKPDTVVNLACDMGGMGYIASHRYECMRSVRIAIAATEACKRANVERYLFASSACVYPYAITGRELREDDAWQGRPEPGYGYEKLFSEELALEAGYSAVRFHNVYGPHGSWMDGREKAPAAMCRKAAIARLLFERDDVPPTIDVWGTGEVVRTFLWIDDAVEGVMRMLQQDAFHGPVNLGSDETVTVNGLAMIAGACAGLGATEHSHPLLNHVQVDECFVGDPYRSSDNTRCDYELGVWARTSLRSGMQKTYGWIESEVRRIGVDKVIAAT